ncbi:long-chain-fatty-acid-CoA ligase, putative [Bodo saltans]|uniref:Long-chain-fatty-acid-CoA ligase, putative n=1 Tax=Bodo saltans TaxID=75058 RepID=A0A0S4IL67_BODSA|nr:long-chain-fatty-acid-CoA ligase, putative [Bodo saltans]|eukprot:CUE70897.1 long-chain-fatty-acid-CoA ligase, putative [Bodo saltans]
MLRRTCHRLRIVPFSELFEYCNVLTSVFSSPGERPCISVEVPGQPNQRFTYGDLQRDIVALANTISTQLDTAANGGDGDRRRSLGLQLPRSRQLKGVFHGDKDWVNAAEGRHFSHDVLVDDGTYNAAILCSPSYEYVVSMLAVWSLGLMAVPIAPSHHYEGEITHVLEHSASRLMIVERSILQTKLPPAYQTLLGAESNKKSDIAASTTTVPSTDATFCVNNVLDISNWMVDHRQKLFERKVNQGAMDEELQVDILPPEAAPRPAPKTSEEAIAAVQAAREEAKRIEEQKKEEQLFDEFRRSLKQTKSAKSSFVPPLTFDDARLDHELNAVFRGRYSELEQSKASPITSARFLINEQNDSLMIYTSGTTAKPKGVVHTHSSIDNQVDVLRRAWRWTAEDTILNTLPLHHVHGVVNVLLCALTSGAHCIMSPFDNATRIAHRLDQGDISLFMGVPTMYTKLIDAVSSFSPIEQTGWRGAVSQNIRLMVSGSAALPVPVLERFRAFSGHTLLERYGMTEVGMALSQPYNAQGRIPGTVGAPLPGVDTLLIGAKEDEAKTAGAKETAASPVLTNGALALRSKSLFDRYWRNPKATMGELVVDDATGLHYFASGDTVGQIPAPVLPSSSTKTTSLSPSAPHFQILGRTSVDIIKHKGYKLSALEIETALLQEPNAFTEVAVFGFPREDVDEEVVAVVALHSHLLKTLLPSFTIPKDDDTQQLSFAPSAVNDQLRKIGRHHLAHYKAPSRYIVVEKIPRNAMGKVNKKDLKKRVAA